MPEGNEDQPIGLFIARKSGSEAGFVPLRPAQEEKKKEGDSVDKFFDLHQEYKETLERLEKPDLNATERGDLQSKADELDDRLDGIIGGAGFSFVHRTIRQEGFEFAKGVEDQFKERQGQLVTLAEEIGLFNDASVTIPEVLASSTWDNFRINIITAKGNLSAAAQNYYKGHPELQGMVETVIDGTMAAVSVGGIRQKVDAVAAAGGSPQLPPGWLNKHYPNEAIRGRLVKDSLEDYLYKIAGPDPEGIVGSNLSKEPPAQVEFPEEVAEVLKTQQGILERFGERDMELQHLIALSTEQTSRLVESFRGQGSWEERKRWVDVEYNKDFYTRFQPNQEPKFYTEMVARHPELKKVWDIRWQLARAAYFKVATSGTPERYHENKDLELLNAEQLETLYKIPGVRTMLEAWAIQISNGASLTDPVERNEREIKSIYDCKSMEDVEAFREKLRNESLDDDVSISIASQQLWQELTNQGIKVSLNEINEQLSKEADAVAFNLMYVYHQIESSNSFYSHNGLFRSNEPLVISLPGAIESADFRGALHQNERFFGKCVLRQNWSAFSPWGNFQMSRIENDVRVQFPGHLEEQLHQIMELKYRPARKGEYWEHRTTRAPTVDNEGKTVKGQITIFVPECHPVTACGSLFEETKTNGKTLLQHLINGDEIDWTKVPFEDISAAWLWGKMRRANSLVEVFNPEADKKFQLQNPATARSWINRVIEILGTRLKIGEVLDNIRKNKRTTFQTPGTIKAWAVYADSGGVKNVSSKKPTLVMALQKRIAVVSVLKDREVNYFAPGEDLNLV